MSRSLGGVSARLPELAAPLSREAWLEARARRLALCEGAAVSSALLPACLASWGGLTGLLQAELETLEPPAHPEVDALCAWVHGPGAEHEGSRAEAEWDRAACSEASEGEWTPEQRRVAALYLLARLGEELQLREHYLPAATTWQADPRDAEAAATWRALLRPQPELAAGPAVRSLYSGRVRAAFAGVSTVLGLPEGVGRAHGEAALEQLELVAVGAHLELATRTLETAGEPVALLESVLDPAGRARVGACIAGQQAWAKVAGLLGRSNHGLGEGADLVVLLRLLGHLRRGRARAHPLGLPGWAVVVANRSRIRGRLRAVVGERPEAFAAAVARLDAPFARTSAAVSRFAWAWAWREARRGFGFDLARMLPAPCVVAEARQAPLPPLEEEHEATVLAFLLVVLGRGCWAELEAWLSGAPGRDLSRTFYRCLEQLPDAVADPTEPGQRHRSYQRLMELLGDDGLEQLLPRLRELALGLAAVPTGPGLRERVAQALDEHWRDTGLPMPRHHLSTFVENCASLLSWGPPAGSG